MNNNLKSTHSTATGGQRVWLTRFAGLLVVASLAACGSSVKLDDVPVEDRTGGAAGQAGAGGGTGSGVDPRGVSGVEVPGMDSQQPEAMARVVYFDYDSFEVRGEYAATLEANARYLKANSSRKIALEGHTDERGGREYNLALGQKRAEAVRRSLSLMGVSESQMEPVSFGEEKPAALGMDEESYAKNRRVELTYR
ncbi:MAG: peptidoglycan-associated lipoprotein Pal [Hydrogenophaga sp.]|nr:peptidoglycan-associated lipoprotein Pal [Hydrogenophaga sp.]